jgi:hypothetical protein
MVRMGPRRGYQVPNATQKVPSFSNFSISIQLFIKTQNSIQLFIKTEKIVKYNTKQLYNVHCRVQVVYSYRPVKIIVYCLGKGRLHNACDYM